MTEWAPATDAEVAMRDALRTDDQESYFRILAGVDLLLPVSADALAGLAPLGWGTWSTGGRTHVLAFTSPSALQACLADYTGSARRVAYSELADTWPNLEWWLAVNPGLPIEGYLPAWFVAQLSRGDLRLPTRGPAREGTKATQHLYEVQADPVAANATAAPGGTAAQGGPAGPGSQFGAEPARSAAPAGGSGFGGPAGGGAGDAPGGGAGDAPGGAPGQGAPGQGAPGQGAPGQGGLGQSGPGQSWPGQSWPGPSRLGQGGATRPAAAAAFGNPGSGTARPPAPTSPVGPGGLPLRTPGTVLPSGLPSRIPASSPTAQEAASFPGFGALDADDGSAPSSPAVPAAYRPPGLPDSTGSPPSEPGATPGSGGPSSLRPGFGGPRGATPEPASSGPPAGTSGPGAGSWPGAGTAGPGVAAASGPAPGSLSDPRGSLPTRTPMAQTPPLPSHIAPPDETPRPGTDGLPRRPTNPPAERPPSMAAAAQTLAGSRTPPASPSSVVPPVIPGAGGPGRTPTVPAASIRPTIPPAAPDPPSPAEQGPPEDDFVPANDVERDLLDAAEEGSTDRFLSTLLLATVLVPVEDNSRPGSSPGEAGFVFRTEEMDDERFLVVFTSRDRLAEHFTEPTRTVGVRFYELIHHWPDPAWSFAVNPESPVGAKYPGPQVIALASWATDAGLGADPAEVDEPVVAPVPAPEKVTDAAQHATVMQKAVPAEQVDYYLDRGYDRVAGFVHRANEVEHLRTPQELFGALGLVHDGSPYLADAKEAFVLRWPAYRPSLYRIPYGGQSEQALRAMDGWVIERPPFRGNGFAPGEGRDVIAEFKVDSVRLPHGAQLWRMDADGTEKMVAILDCDAPVWRRVGDQS